MRFPCFRVDLEIAHLEFAAGLLLLGTLVVERVGLGLVGFLAGVALIAFAVIAH